MMPDEERFERMYLNFKPIFLQRIKSGLYLQPVRFRAISSAGSEHLPYKQRVGGSNPSSPTT